MSAEQNYNFTIEHDDAGIRMDGVLARLIEETSRNSIQRLIEKGGVSVNGQVINTKKHKLKEGDYVELILQEPLSLEAYPENIPIDIVYEDTD